MTITPLAQALILTLTFQFAAVERGSQPQESASAYEGSFPLCDRCRRQGVYVNVV
jgi:hypothetical protein